MSGFRELKSLGDAQTLSAKNHNNMATRRLVSKNVTRSARFLMMSEGAQNLYWHLCQDADDDGIVEAYTVMKLLATNEDNLKLLVGKEFVKILSSDLITYIMDWPEHNRMRADRKVDSIYQGLLLQILPEVKPFLIVPKKRADRKLVMLGRPEDTTGTQLGHGGDANGTQLGRPIEKSEEISQNYSGTPVGRPKDTPWTEEDRLGQDKLNKENINQKIGDGFSNEKPDELEITTAEVKPMLNKSLTRTEPLTPPLGETPIWNMTPEQRSAYMKKYHNVQDNQTT